jgi:hypothetical protein
MCVHRSPASREVANMYLLLLETAVFVIVSNIWWRWDFQIHQVDAQEVHLILFDLKD